MQIDTDIPIPSKKLRASKYDWAEDMEVGHSVKFKDAYEARKVYMSLRKRYGERKWTLRTQEDGGIRIWRKL
tara:strand:+ start:18 stop:233 length:216 start_codon:yes stop_codon:yes gene_type:complete